MQQRASGKRRTGYMYSDSSPRRQPLPRDEERKLRALTRLASGKRVPPVRQPGTVKAQLLGKLGATGYQRLIGALREDAE
ncbi:MAG: hypothetical protein KGL39_29855 [Patescibacteria group bacterium]|nr:hypothetical protein [Patescibacteria group bacterium]